MRPAARVYPQIRALPYLFPGTGGPGLYSRCQEIKLVRGAFKMPVTDFVADFLDAQKNIGILGTLAGENTVFVAPILVNTIDTVYKAVCKKLYFKTS